jgi:hypothetical protein
MKKIMTMLVVLTFSITACADRHQMIGVSDLPAQAQAFIQKHFNISDIAYIERDRDAIYYEYNVYLKNATEIDFDHQGNFQSIDCKRTSVPEGIVPESIISFISSHYPNLFVVEYIIDYRHQTVELNNEIELIFDRKGHFLRMDD